MEKAAIFAALASLTISTAAHAEAAVHSECANILPPENLRAGQRPLNSEDLVRLRDIGPAEPQDFPDPLFTLSPDGRWAAFQLRRADPEVNHYCLAIVVLDLSRKVAPRIVDEGGDPLLYTMDLRGIAELPSGLMRVITPRWSGDGSWIAFLKRDRGTTQVWRAFADGSGSAPLTHSNVDIADFRIGNDGSSIVYLTFPGIEKQRAVNDREGLNGWHYDDRFAPWFSKWPLPHGPVERDVQVLDPATGKVREATPDEIEMVNSASELRFTDPAPASDAKGLEIASTNIFGRAQAGSFHAKLADGSAATCMSPACQGAMHPWWMPGKTHVRFMRQDGWANASTAITTGTSGPAKSDAFISPMIC